ncbi:MAG: cytochrome C, partial [Bacteroidota bacterium]
DVPPLAGSDWVVGRRDQLLRIVLGGLEGEVVVQGETYSGTMPRLWGASDAAVAAVVTYVRTSWGNDASPVSEQDVVAVRQFVDQRTAPWTVEELEQATLLLED